MKQSTFSAFVANSIQKVLQGYTKGIRLIAVLTLLLTVGIGQAWGADYELVTSAPSDWSGEYLIVAGTSALSGSSGSWGTYKTVTVSNNNKISTTENISVTISKGGTSGTYYIFMNSNSMYLKEVTSNSFATASTSDTDTEWKISLSNGNAQIACASAATRYLRLNGTSGYRCYTSNTGTLPKLYKKAASTNFTVGETLFIQAQSSSAWNDGACVKAWFNGNSTAATTYWLYDATGSDAGKKMFATIVPSGTSSKVQIQRFASNCSTWWNSNGDLSKSDGANSNIVQTYGGGTNSVAWNSGKLELYLYGSPNSWGSSLATFTDDGNGIWTASYEDYEPTATSDDFKIKDSYNGWIGDTGSNNNATLSEMVVGSTYDITATLDIKDHSLTLSKELKKCQVHFDKNGHGADIASKTNVTPNSTITEPTAPIDDDYKFEGWFTDANCTDEWDFASDKVTETMTLYAKWTKKVSYTITWKVNNNDHLVGTPTTSIYEGFTYQDLTLPTAPGDDALEACYPEKVFVGWSTHDLGYEETTEPNDLFTSDNVPDTEITENKTFYAVFATETGGGTISTPYKFTISSNDFNTTSYAANNNEKTSTATATDASGATMPVKWTSYQVMKQSSNMQWQKNNGYIYNSTDLGTITSVTVTSSAGDFTTHYGTSTQPSSGSQGDGKGYFKTSVGSATGQTTKVEVSFTKSTTSPASYSGYVTECYCVTQIALAMTGGYQNLDVGDTNQLLVTYTPDDATCGNEIATWTSSNDNVISVDDQGLVTANMAGSATITATTTNGISNNYIITVNNPACDAWYLHYWNASITGDECFYKVKPDDDSDHEWRTNNFSLPSNSDEDKFIVLNANGADTYQADQIFRIGIGFADIQRGGLNCGTNPYPGQDAYGQLSIYDNSETPNRYIAFYPAQYMVTFGKEGSSGWVEMPLTNTNGYEYESEPFMVPNGYKTDNSYKYWVGITKQNGSMLYVDGKSSVDAMNTVNGLSTSDMAGKWGVWHIWSNSCANNWYAEFIRYYRVDFNLNGGEGDNIDPRYGKAAEPYATFSTTDITAPTRDEHTFLGWEDQNGNTYSPTESTVTINDDLTLTAQWAQNHTLTYDLAGGDGTACDAATTYYTGQSFTVCSGAGERTGYTFNGWLGSDGNTYNAGGTYTMPDEDLTITAQWTRDTYTITWNVAGEETTTTIDTGDPVVLPDETPTSCSSKYATFVGWYTAASGMETAPSDAPLGTQVTASTVPEGNVTYYAVWADAAAGGGGWEKVTTFEVGDVVIFVNEEDSRELTGISDNDIGTATTFSTSPAGTYPLTIEAGNGGTGYSFKNGSDYLSWSSGNKLYTTTEKNNSSSWTISEDTDGNYKFANVGTTERILQYNSNSGQERWACYTSGQTTFQIYKQASSATGYISSCCQSPAVVTVAPESSSLELNLEGTASTTVNISQSGGGNGKYYEPTVSPADGASLDWAALGVTFKQTAYDINFTATKVGTYTVTGNFTETSYGCQKTGSATINVVANPILQVSAEELTFTPTCGQNSASQEVEINSRYLTANSITATVATTSGSGKFTISTDNTTFGTSNLTLSGGIATKVTDQIYVRYEAEEGETGAVAGTLTLKCGSTQKVITLSGACTCSANVTITGDPIQITAANGIWVEASHELTATGTFLTTNADNANVSIRAYTNNTAFQIKTGGTTGEGTANALTLGTNISNPDWNGNIGIVYKPTQAGITETATLTVEVYRYNGSTVYSTATYELEGRSLPEQFVIAVTNGSGDWFAVPADMIAPWGDACSGLGTFAPYPITVDNSTTPTSASDVPARAIYQAAARTGSITTNPQTLSYKSVPLASSGNYYLYGSSTNVDSDGNNTNIQNASFAASEKQKWFLDVVDWNTKQYNMHIHADLTTNVLAYTTASGANRVGQYGATAGTTKKSIYLLPITGTTCTYYAAPKVTITAIDATNATIQFKNDRTTAYEISLDQNTWTDLAVTEIKECGDGVEATILQAQLPLATYRGQTVYIRAKVTTGTACQETGWFIVPDPTINRGETPWKYTGMAGQAFSDDSKSVTINDLWNALSVSVVQQVTGSNISASITPEGVVTVSMAAEDATEGEHKAVLEFSSAGATTVQVGVVITLYKLAIQEFDGGNQYVFTETNPIVLCQNEIDDLGLTPTVYLSYALYKDDAVITETSQLNQTNFTLVDLSTSESLTFSREVEAGGLAKITFNATTLAAMVSGHTYRLSWENTNKVMTNEDGLPYMDCYMDFVYSENCDAPTALPACPITNSGFTANWVPVIDCTGNVTVDVYTKAEGSTMWSIDYTQKPTLNVWTFAGLSGMQEEGGWYCDQTSNSAQISYTNAGIQIAKASTYGQLYSPTFANMNNVPADLANTEVTISITHISNNGSNYKFRVYAVETTTAKADVPYKKNKMYDVYFNGSATKSGYLELTGGSEETTSTITIKGLTSTSHILLYGNQSSAAGPRIKQFAIKNSTTKTSVATQTLSCSAGSAEFTGLTANTQYYYTVSDGTNTSNEIAVTTLADGITPTLEFGAGAANLQAESACVSEEIELTGTCMPICDPSDISFAITGTNASMFTYDASNLIITPATGELSGTITITYCPGSEQGNHSALLTATAGTVEATLQLIGTNCPTGFSTMATDATNITATSATANWTHATTGYVMFSTNGKVNTNLLLNSGFELGTKEGWNELEKLSTEISTKSTKSGTYSLFVPQSQLSFYVTADKKAGPVFANKLTLAPGSYTITANVQGAATDASATAYLAGEFYLGFYNGSKVVYCSDAIKSESNKNWQEISASFTLDAEMTVYPFVAHTNSDGAFFLDDVSLVCTFATMGENAIEYPITDAKSLDLTGLQPSTSYSYYVVNEYGCESNIITFTTESSDAVPTLSAEDVEIIGPVGKTTNGTFFITATNAYAAIVLTNGCNNSPITLATATVPQTGGVVSFSFTPNETHEVIGSGTCTISMITTGMTNPATVNIHWTVAAGEDPNTPIVEVTDITNTSLTIEHNQTTDPNTEVHIVISRETTDEEAGKNLGDEIFFSKYYEAYSHKKLWAIYNPTDRPISLDKTYVWRSNGDGDAWSIDIGMDLSQMGNIEPGYIYPNEELIVYTADQVGTCEHEKADMSNWVAMSSNDRALSFSGDDALLLVRQDILDSTDDDPTTESQEKEKDENGVDIEGTNKELSWRRYYDEETDTYWWMLDIIGARKNNNTPDNSATKNWTCATTGDKGDAEGWVGAQGDDIAGKYSNAYTLSTNRCLLIRKMTVKSGNNATLENVGDMYTLNTEWRGAHVPHSDDQEETSCENFSFVGGYDYDGYYNAWTSLMDINATEATRNDDGSYTADGIEVPRFYCHPLRIEVYITETINGEEIDNVKAYLDYKVPIVVDKDITTADQIYFKYPERTDAAIEPDFVTSNERSENILDDEICAECDVVIRDGAKLTHIEDGKAEFRTMQVYPTAKFEIPAGLNMQLEGLHMYAKNDEVGYAIINNDGSSIHAEDIIHIKRIDDMYWYPFSLPYDCKVSSIYQINGKSMGEYWVDWGIKYYDGEARQQEGDNYAGGATSKFWKKLDASETLKAHQGYIIGLFTTEWQGQMKSIYFPPVENTEYTEGGNDAKTTYISNWSDNLTCEPRHRGWNFTGLPYISLFSSQNGDGTTNNNSLMMGSQTDDYATSSIVYVSIPDGGDSRTYTQVSAASVKLEPFKPYFVQAMDPTDGQSHDDIALTYSKGGRTLDKIQARSAASTQATIMVELVVANQDATLTDNAGVLVNDRYTENYEIAADLMKMYAEDRKPQLFTRAANNEMMAYNALPDCLAQNIPLGLFVPTAGEYTISILEDASQLADAEAAYLLYEGEIVANLLYSDYTIVASQRGQINGYSLDIRRKQNTTTNINNLTDGAPIVTIVDGQIVIQQLPDNAEVQIIDVLGRVLYQQANVPDIITFQAPATGVYNVVITTTEQQFTHKTIIR